MIEPEIAFAELPDLIELAEEFISHIVQAALRDCEPELATLERDVKPLLNIKPPFPRITYSEAVELLRSPATRERLEAELEKDREKLQRLQAALEEKEAARAAATKGWQQEKLDREIHSLREDLRELETDLRNRPQHIADAGRFEWGRDLGGDEETILSKQFDRPLVITEYPKSVKAFYMKPNPKDPRVVLNLDVIAPEGYGEVIGGSQREDDLVELEKRMAEEGMDPAPYRWYTDLRRYGTVPHGGFGLGLERTVAWICGLRHIRETIPFPRMMGRMTP